jgi:hypothetical protein
MRWYAVLVEFSAKGYAMTTVDVPADGEMHIGAIRLPAGRRIRSSGGRGEPGRVGDF